MLSNVQVVLGILVSVFDMLLLMIYLRVILTKSNRKTSSIVHIACFLGVCGVQYAVSRFVFMWEVNIGFSLLGVFVLTFLYNSKMLTRVFAAFSIQVFAMLAELLAYSILLMIIGSDVEITANIKFYGMLLSKLILFTLIIVVSLIKKRDSFKVRVKDYAYLIVTPFISLATIIAITIESDNFSDNSWGIICFIVAGISIINITVYYLMENIIDAGEIREKQLRMETQFEFQEQKYEQTSLSFKKISGIIHDTNKHLLYLRECVSKGETAEALLYIDKATENVEKSYKRINTGNLVIDALVSNAFNTAFANNISFKSDIRIENGRVNIERYDLSVTLGNLLDNAVEACKKISNPDDKYIHFSIFTSDVALVVNIVNSKSLSKSKDLKTDKVDKIKHGYGLDNVRAVIEKYGGTFTVDNSESRFEVTAILPLQDEK